MCFRGAFSFLEILTRLSIQKAFFGFAGSQLQQLFGALLVDGGIDPIFEEVTERQWTRRSSDDRGRPGVALDQAELRPRPDMGRPPAWHRASVPAAGDADAPVHGAVHARLQLLHQRPPAEPLPRRDGLQVSQSGQGFGQEAGHRVATQRRPVCRPGAVQAAQGVSQEIPTGTPRGKSIIHMNCTLKILEMNDILW